MINIFSIGKVPIEKNVIENINQFLGYNSKGLVFMQEDSSKLFLQISVNSSRSNSLVPGEVEVTRQFVATNKKVINRGDSFKHKQRPVVNISSCERQNHKFEGKELGKFGKIKLQMLLQI